MVSAHKYHWKTEPSLIVLNALRHQWFRHTDYPNLLTETTSCSTPYGINGFGTAFWSNKMNVVVEVLNALRHQWFRHTKKNCNPKGLLTCAQRLTASMVSAPENPSHTAHELRVLNALRHQWFRHEYQRGLEFNRDECSTPYGINGFGTSGINRPYLR